MIALLFLLLVNLSAALKTIEPNKGVGLLDTDVYGPSVPLMMNLHETPLLTKGTLLHCSFPETQILSCVLKQERTAR